MRLLRVHTSTEHFLESNPVQLTIPQIEDLFTEQAISLPECFDQAFPTLVNQSNLDQTPTANRQSLKEFLKGKAKKMEGVQFYDGDENLIKIPWVHASKKNWSEDCCQIFTDWAKNTGKPASDVRKCKANFRCALNSLRDVNEVTELSKKDGLNSYRVYAIVKEKSFSRHKRVTKRKNDGTHKSQPKMNSSLFESPPTSPSYPEMSSPDCLFEDLIGLAEIVEVESAPPSTKIPLPVLNLRVDDNGDDDDDDEYKPKRLRVKGQKR